MAKGQMVINYVPGEDCRVAVVYDGKLNELHAERMDNVSHVGNIYVGKVVNVEAAIQAAFVDFGLEHNGFLHVSDLHPQYFPDANDETTERVGKKTPRRDRPPIQECLRRGQEIAVQVLKEGVGTKGPTVTSYLSIPGRFLVMMPQMDRVGVSRKVEDEETRRKMREILDQLDLPEGFGFILRTAGMDRGKLELKRDLAYLSRLWKDMEKRWKSGNKPRLLYSESDLLVRALRDILSSDIEEVVVDNDAAMQRAARFLKIVAPRSTSTLVHYRGKTPIFHAMGLEEQIQMIHAREVPLPSGGRLVIDETEALVAIDVNSGKSRDARDAETNAFRTNMEATEEICRQLRLRDLGGVIVNDLIDMRFSKHRRDVENKFKELLKKDRARWTTAPISEFGILEMTRQRMRGSHESQHFADCPVCRGRGLVQRPDSVAADGLRDLAATLDQDRVHRVEMVVHPRIAGELLSTKRRMLTRIERASGKHVDVRVSDAIPVDRVTFYAYDDRGADIDVSKLGRRKLREDELVEFVLPKAAPVDDWGFDTPPEPEPVEESEPSAEMVPHPIEIDPDDMDENAVPSRSAAGGDEGGERRGRRRRRRGRRGRGGAEGAPVGEPREGEAPRGEFNDGATEGGEEADAPAARPVRGHASNNGHHAVRPVASGPGTSGGPGGPLVAGPDGEGEGGGRRRRRRRRRGGRGRSGAPGVAGGPNGVEPGGVNEGFGPGGESEPDSGEFESSDSGRLEVGAVEADPDAPSNAWQGEEGAAEGSRDDRGPGPEGGPAGEGGEAGGPRRRRRRRRGGRGRNRGGEGGPAGAMAGSEAPQGFDGPRDDAGGAYTAAVNAAAASGGDDGGDIGDAGGFDDQESSDAGEPVEAGVNAEPGVARGGEGGEGGGRRRRRRRRGRGGNGTGGGSSVGGGGNGGDAGGQRVNEQRREGSGGPRGHDDRGGGGGGRDRDRGRGRGGPGGGGSGQGGGGQERNAPAPRPTAAQPNARSNSGSPAPAPKPRTLYASRRRLGPSERRPGGGDE